MTQEEVDSVFAITAAIFNNDWFKEKKRTLPEVQAWVAEKLESLHDIHTEPMGCSWGMITSKKVEDDR
jgi:hypothetical protein